MDTLKILKAWTKLCLRQGNAPVCLITVSDDGVPCVYTKLDPKAMQAVFKLLSSGPPSESDVVFHNQEN